jgi:copper(I)-binding protein
MRKFFIILLLALTALGISYKLGYLDKPVKRYILKEKLSKSSISSTPANAAITVHDATIQAVSGDSENTVLTFTLKNTTNKTHELIRIETEISNDVSFFEPFHKDGKREIIKVFGVPIEGFSIVTLTPKNNFAQINNITAFPKTGDSINVRLLFSDNSKKNIVATVK